MGALGLFLKKSIYLVTIIVCNSICFFINEPYNLLNPVYLRVTRRSNTYTYINESPILFHPLLPYEGPSGEWALNYRLDATANDEVSPGAGGAMSAGEKSIKRAIRSCWRKRNGKGGQNLPYQANSDAACGANASAFGPNAACTSLPVPFSSTASSRSVRTFHQQTLPRQLPDSPRHSRPPSVNESKAR